MAAAPLTWFEHPTDPLESGVPLPRSQINAWKRLLVIAEIKAGFSARYAAIKHGVSHDTAARWVRCL